jgi:thioredoxin-like negative regulator of GroEL
VTPTLARLILAVGLVALGWIGYQLANRLMLKRADRAQRGLENRRPNTPAVLYFTTPTCMPCKTTQRPALARLLELTGDQIQVIQVETLERPDLAESWGVLSVPTTFVIDSQGQARRVNHGAASAEKLLAQLEEVEGRQLQLKPGLFISEPKTHAPGMD